METRTFVNNYGIPTTYRVVVPSMKVILVYSPSGDMYFQEFADTVKCVGAQYRDLVIDIAATKFAEDCYVNLMEGDMKDTLAHTQIMDLCNIWDYTCDKTYKFVTEAINSYLSIGTDVFIVNMNNDSHFTCTYRVHEFCEKGNITCTSIALHSCANPELATLEATDPKYRSGKYTTDYTLIYSPETKDSIISLFYKQYMGYKQ